MNYLKSMGNQVYGAGRNLYFAGLGVAVISCDRDVKVFGGLVEKGRTVRAQRETTAAEKANQKTRLTGLGKAAGERVQNGISGTLNRLGIPNREEIRGLTRSVEQLTEKVANLQPKLAE